MRRNCRTVRRRLRNSVAVVKVPRRGASSLRLNGRVQNSPIPEVGGGVWKVGGARREACEVLRGGSPKHPSIRRCLQGGGQQSKSHYLGDDFLTYDPQTAQRILRNWFDRLGESKADSCESFPCHSTADSYGECEFTSSYLWPIVVSRAASSSVAIHAAVHWGRYNSEWRNIPGLDRTAGNDHIYQPLG